MYIKYEINVKQRISVQNFVGIFIGFNCEKQQQLLNIHGTFVICHAPTVRGMIRIRVLGFVRVPRNQVAPRRMELPKFTKKSPFKEEKSYPIRKR